MTDDPGSAAAARSGRCAERDRLRKAQPEAAKKLADLRATASAPEGG